LCCFMCSVLFPAEKNGFCYCLESWSPGLSSRIPYGDSEYQIYVPESYDGVTAVPMILTLHGDEGDPAGIVSSFQYHWQSRNDAICVAPRAPYASGSWWNAMSEHEAWLDGLIDKITSEYKIDMNQIYVTGWSGGACLMGHYTLVRQGTFAAAGYCMGACYAMYNAPPDPSCRIPSRYVVGTEDFLYDQASQHAAMLESNGHEVDFVEIPGLGHSPGEDCFASQLEWMISHRLCGRTAEDPSCEFIDDADETPEPYEEVMPEVTERPAEILPEPVPEPVEPLPDGTEADGTTPDFSTDNDELPDSGDERLPMMFEGECACSLVR
jgi:hypothetical protein